MHKIHTKDKIKIQILADTSWEGIRITTFKTKMPLHAWIHLLTHRAFSRNLSSSRAIPTKALLQNAEYVPPYVGLNKAGMSPDNQVPNSSKILFYGLWSIHQTISKVFARMSNGLLKVHKETSNRFLMPHIMVEGLVTGTDFSNFFKLRTERSAQYDIRQVALLMRKAMIDNIPIKSKSHLPYYREEYEASDKYDKITYIKAACGRCARVSYNKDLEVSELIKNVSLGVKLQHSGHWSPFEHVALFKTKHGKYGNFRGWRSIRHVLEQDERIKNEE